MTAPVGSVVIPAWNEAAVIGSTLDVLFEGIEPDALEVVVACNGCTDGTEAIARERGYPLLVLSLPAVGKARAIRAAEAAAVAMPRLYLDADVRLPGLTALKVLEALTGGAITARPAVVYDAERSSWPVRQFVAVRARLSSVNDQLWGAGVYGLSVAARRRFGEFPDVVADDLFVQWIAGDDPVVVVQAEPATVRMPRSTRALLSTLTRVYQGNRQLQGSVPTIARSTTRTTTVELMALARSPRWMPSVAVYASLVVAARLWSMIGPRRWHRDTAARVEVGR